MTIDRDGVVWPAAAGRFQLGAARVARPTSSAAASIPPRLRQHFRGWNIEVANNGVGEPWPQVQIDAYLPASNALQRPLREPAHRRHHPRPQRSATGGRIRKIDPATATAVEGPWKPRGITSSGTWRLDDIRAECTRQLATTTPEPEPEPKHHRRGAT